MSASACLWNGRFEAYTHTKLALTGLSIQGQTAPDGGAIWAGQSTGEQVMLLDRCEFIGNSATRAPSGSGGALHLYGGAYEHWRTNLVFNSCSVGLQTIICVHKEFIGRKSVFHWFLLCLDRILGHD